VEALRSVEADIEALNARIKKQFEGRATLTERADGV
jgi:hypothetical protein